MKVSTKGLRLADEIMAGFLERKQELAQHRSELLAAYETIRGCFEKGRTLYACGNGGSYSDALHICGELMKSFERIRPLPPAHRRALAKDPLGKDLVEGLEAGLRAVALGTNGSLSSAIWNDKPHGAIHFAQELYVLGNPGDVLLAISTSGRSRAVLYAMAVARLLGIRTIGLTGEDGGDVARRADISLRLPGASACDAQESHESCYHTLCLALEATFFPGTSAEAATGDRMTVGRDRTPMKQRS